MSTKLSLLSAAITTILCHGVTNAQAEDLINLIPGLYGGDGITMSKTQTLPDGRVIDHFEDFQVEPCSPADVLCALNEEISSEMEPVPVSPSPGGFTYRFDPETGTYVQTSKKLGLLVSERPQTLGKGKFSLIFGYTFFEYDSFEGKDLDNLVVRFDHRDIPSIDVPDENDWIEVNLDMNMKVQTLTLGGTYGLTDKLDITAIIPYVDVDMDVTAYATYYDFDAETNPVDRYLYDESRADTASGDASGLGDIILGAKYYWIDQDMYDVAAALRVKFDTGDEDNFLGTGDTRIRPMIIATRELSEIVTAHINAGFEYNTDSDKDNRWLYSFGLDSGDSKFTAAFDILGRHDIDGDGIGDDKIDAGIGVKWSPVDNFILAGNMLFPLNRDEGLRSDVITTLSLEYRN